LQHERKKDDVEDMQELRRRFSLSLKLQYSDLLSQGQTEVRKDNKRWKRGVGGAKREGGG
jgi:hypothetical protein